MRFNEIRATILLAVFAAVSVGCSDAPPDQDAAGSTWSASPIVETRPLFTEFFPPEEFAQRRDVIFDAIGPSAIAVIQGAPSPMGFVAFRQSNEFFYLSGIESPHAYLVLDGATRQTHLYLMPRNERREYGEGKLLSAEDGDLIAELAGISNVHPLSALRDDLRARRGVRTVYAPFRPAELRSTTPSMANRTIGDYADDPMDLRPARHEDFLRILRQDLPGSAFEDVLPILDEARMIKSPREIEVLRASSRLQGLAILEAMRSTQPGVTEYDLEAVGRYLFRLHNAQGEGYYALTHVASNAHMNHYHAGVRAALDGDMILMDYGADFHYYTSDMGRMWPANGRFNPVQRELYGFYLAFYEAILNRIRPHVTAQQIKLEALEEIDAFMENWTFTHEHHAQAARDFVEAYRVGAQNPNTRLGHGVGMAAHDPLPYEGVLRPGMVFVIEPQFRVSEEMIYVRLEDTILLTEDGVEIFTDFVPRDMERIERLVQSRGGILQDYPRMMADDGTFLQPALDLIELAGPRR